MAAAEGKVATLATDGLAALVTAAEVLVGVVLEVAEQAGVALGAAGREVAE